MAINPSPLAASWRWPARGPVMPEQAYLEPEYYSPERNYTYLMSGGSGAPDRITRPVGYALDSRLLAGPCQAFDVDVQVLLATRKSGQRHYVYPDATLSSTASDQRLDNMRVRFPRVGVAVLSPGTRARDRGLKRKHGKIARPFKQSFWLASLRSMVKCGSATSRRWEREGSAIMILEEYLESETLNCRSILWGCIGDKFCRG